MFNLQKKFKNSYAYLHVKSKCVRRVERGIFWLHTTPTALQKFINAATAAIVEIRPFLFLLYEIGQIIVRLVQETRNSNYTLKVTRKQLIVSF